MTGKPFPILFISALDAENALASSGLIKRLSDEMPDARFTIVAGENAAGLFEAVPNLDRLITVKKAGGLFAQMDLRSKLKDTRWGLVIDTRGTGIAGWLNRDRRAEPKPAPGGLPEHKVLAAARMLNLETDPPSPWLFTSAETEAKAEVDLAGEGPILAVGPGAAWIGRIWPPERFGQVAMKLMKEGAPLEGGRIIAFGHERDREAMLSAKFPIARSQIVLRPYDQDFLTAFAWLKKARLYIGNDNIWTRLAAAAGVPTLALFGPSDEEVDAPWGPLVRVVRGPRDFTAFKAIDPHLDQQMSHMLDLSADQVLEDAIELLRQTEPKKRG
jgi:ADP-heptose:LPS heptosyltransferase